MEKNATTEDMKTLAYCLNKLKLDGFEEDFQVTEKGMCTMDGTTCYQPEEVRIVNFFRFEGASDPADNSILYAIETKNGKKGTLTDAFGPYADEKVDKFIKEVEEMNKKNTTDDSATNG
jgi:hypothetical protein